MDDQSLYFDSFENYVDEVSIICRNVLVKGGHLPDSSEATDVFFDGTPLPLLDSICSSQICLKLFCFSYRTCWEFLSYRRKLSCFTWIARKLPALDHSKDLLIGNGPQGPLDHLFDLSSTHARTAGARSFDANDLFLYAFCKCFDPSSSSSSSHDIREKEAATRDFIEAANACLGICRSHGVPLLINDRVDVALACDADGVHVGQSDMPARVARSILGPQKIIGVSCKTAAQAEQAWADGADYIGCGGVFPTTTKANNLTVGLDGFKAVCLASKLPVVAIGGISSANAGSVMEISVPSLKGVAVVSALFDRECIVTEARRLKSILMDSSSPHAKLMV
ncbi:hypothetical protein BHM03_00008888 [Ensete ventricosum]|nr:hypothetical protein BHM03_00008888 [Ensete ventricosum]